MVTYSPNAMNERTFNTPSGTIHYWTNITHGASDASVASTASASDAAGASSTANPVIVMLPGLTADHHLFDKQIEHFQSTYPIITWDAPAHAASRPFEFTWSLDDKARWVHDILTREGVAARQFVIVGQSMGAYVGQAFIDLFPGEAGGFVSIDSAPLGRQYYSSWELWLLKRMEPVYRWYPHSLLVSQGSKGTATSDYGQALMAAMIKSYEHREYAALAGHGFKILAEAVEKERPYAIDCPALLMCGEFDKAGTAKSYNRRWAEATGIPLVWVQGAGHNANTDKPEFVNETIEAFIQEKCLAR